MALLSSSSDVVDAIDGACGYSSERQYKAEFKTDKDGSFVAFVGPALRSQPRDFVVTSLGPSWSIWPASRVQPIAIGHGAIELHSALVRQIVELYPPAGRGIRRLALRTETKEIKLRGKFGVGIFMQIGSEDWERVKLVLGSNWLWVPGGLDHTGYIGSYAERALIHAGRAKLLVLARWLMSAGTNDFVRYLDGNPKNLTRSNLTLLPHHVTIGQAPRTWTKAALAHAS